MLLLQVKLVNIANLSSKNFPPVCQEGIWSRCLLLVKITRSVKGVNLRLTALAIILVVKTSRQSNRGFFFAMVNFWETGIKFSQELKMVIKT